MWLCYPNNPTSATATRDFFREAIDFAARHDIIVCHDAAYSEIYFDGERPISFLELEGAREVGIEFHSLSKTYNMTGWRVGFAVGNPELIAGLGKVKTNVDSGVFQAVQEAAIAALAGDQDCVEKAREIYRARRDLLLAGARASRAHARRVPRATFYVWVDTPKGYTSAEFATKVLEQTGVVITPGTGFGPSGEGYVRFSLTVNGDRLSEAVSPNRKDHALESMPGGVFIGLGSNLGDRRANIREAIDLIRKLPDTRIVKESSLYESEPHGNAKTWFVNGVIEIETDAVAGEPA